MGACFWRTVDRLLCTGPTSSCLGARRATRLCLADRSTHMLLDLPLTRERRPNLIFNYLSHSLTVQPAARAGATLRVIIDMGKFQGVMAANSQPAHP
jgi:hypothetical protein